MDIEAILAMTFLFGIPSIALAIHLVVRPIVKDVLSLRAGKDSAHLEARIERLEEIVGDLDQRVMRLVEAERFRRELEAGPAERKVRPQL